MKEIKKKLFHTNNFQLMESNVFAIIREANDYKL